MPATILIVEDNPTTRKMLRIALASEGYAVIEAPDARTAITSVEQTLPDLVLQDLILPDMDGLELVGRLRRIAGTSELPIIALSGFLSRLEESRTADAGFAALLVKPIEPSRLVDTIRTYLPRQQTQWASVGRGRRLLLVDDDAVQLKLARIHLEQLGFEVMPAASGAEALALARGRPPDIILSDVFMDGLDGFELCFEVRQDPALTAVPVVLVSSRYGASDDHDLARRVGANALIMRTPDLAVAIHAILEALKGDPPAHADQPSDQLRLQHAERVINQLERQTGALSGLAQRAALQAAQLALLSGVADALTRKADTDLALRDVLAATLDAAGISKGALMLKDDAGRLTPRQQIGFSASESAGLRTFFGHFELLESIVERGATVTVPSSAIASELSGDILGGASVSSLQIAPLMADGRGVGAMIVGATRTDVTSHDSVTFARAMGNQIVQSLALAKTVADLAASEQRYRTLLESANDAIAVLTPDGTIREINHRWESITGAPRERLIGRPVGEVLRPARSNGEEEPALGALTANAGRPVPLDIMDAAGRRVLLEFSNTNVLIAGEALIFTIGRDVTEQRALEESLRQAQKLEAIGQLAGGVAHDFNNMLTAILGFSDLILGSVSADDPIHHDLLEIRNAGQRAAALTRQLLAFSRKQILQPQVLDLNPLVRGLESMLRRLLVESVSLKIALAPGTALVTMDPSQLEQILVNLVVNAADAMPGGGTLTIESAHVALDDEYEQHQLPITPGSYVMLAVSDTGVGMDEAISERIFEPFFTTKAQGKGTGLGLATVHGIVKQSGGDIWVSTSPGKGTSFRIFLPRTVAAVAEEPRRSAPESALGGSETILLVEDEDAVRRLAKLALERSGYHVLEAGDPDAAERIALAHQGPIDLVVSDVIMPNVEGVPLKERLAQARPATPILYISGYADEAIVRHGVLIEGTPFLQKPFTGEVLARKVREVLDSASESAG